MASNMDTSNLEILVGIDSSAASAAAVRYAAELAATRRRPLRVVHGLGLADMGWVYGNMYMSVPSVIEDLQANAAELVTAAADAARDV
ncbi:MAG: universal stress protein, partial [Aldersonia sp.]|nr:universal stress protein [Aldersonia sp.]